MCGIAKSCTSTYNAPGNRQFERYNHTFHNLLRSLQANEKRRWLEHLPELLMIYNVTPHASIGFSPYYQMFGRESELTVDFILSITPEDRASDVEQWLKDHLDL